MISLEDKFWSFCLKEVCLLSLGALFVKKGNSVFQNKEGKKKRSFKEKVSQIAPWYIPAAFCFLGSYYLLQKSIILIEKHFPSLENEVQRFQEQVHTFEKVISLDTINFEQFSYWKTRLSCEDFFLGQAALYIAQRCDESVDENIKKICRENMEHLTSSIHYNEQKASYLTDLEQTMRSRFEEVSSACKDLKVKLKERINKITWFEGVNLKWEKLCYSPLWLSNKKACLLLITSCPHAMKLKI